MSETMKLHLAKAMNECMKKASVENITIKEICFAAHCSRQTFYRCFKDKYDLINWYFDCILRISFDRMGQGRTIYDGLLKKFQYIQEESLFFHAAFSTDSQNNLRQHDFEMIYAYYLDLITKKKQYPLHSKQRDILEIYCFASVYRTAKWVLNGTKETPEELVDILIHAMPQDLTSLFKQLNIYK